MAEQLTWMLHNCGRSGVLNPELAKNILQYCEWFTNVMIIPVTNDKLMQQNI